MTFKKKAMKKYWFFIGLLLLGLSLLVMVQKRTIKKPMPTLTFKQLNHNYGRVYEGDNGIFAFKFINTGNKPLILLQPLSLCSFTVSSWSKAPILPGDLGTIKVTYNTHIVGKFNKTVTVYSTAPNRVVLHIHGEVIPLPKPMLPITQIDIGGRLLIT